MCECVLGVPWEGSARAKIWFVFQTTSFGVAAGPKVHLPLTSSLYYTTGRERESKKETERERVYQDG